MPNKLFLKTQFMLAILFGYGKLNSSFLLSLFISIDFRQECRNVLIDRKINQF